MIVESSIRSQMSNVLKLVDCERTTKQILCITLIEFFDNSQGKILSSSLRLDACSSECRADLLLIWVLEGVLYRYLYGLAGSPLFGSSILVTVTPQRVLERSPSKAAPTGRAHTHYRLHESERVPCAGAVERQRGESRGGNVYKQQQQQQ